MPVWCHVCKITATNQAGLELHFAGRKHQRKLAEGSEPSSIGPQPRSKAPYVRPPAVCQEIPSFVDMGLVRSHSRQPKPPKPFGTKSTFWCSVCEIGCTDQHGIDMHMAGKKHKAVLDKKAGIEPPPKPERPPRPEGEVVKTHAEIIAQFWCHVCKKGATHQKGLDMHLAGKAHREKCQQILRRREMASAPKYPRQQQYQQQYAYPSYDMNAYAMSAPAPGAPYASELPIPHMNPSQQAFNAPVPYGMPDYSQQGGYVPSYPPNGTPGMPGFPPNATPAMPGFPPNGTPVMPSEMLPQYGQPPPQVYMGGEMPPYVQPPQQGYMGGFDPHAGAPPLQPQPPAGQVLGQMVWH